jgi:TatD DNase family protein
MFIDTHTHLYSSQFDLDRDEIIQKAINAGVHKFLLPNIDIESIDGMLDLEKKYPNVCFPMMGLHPCSVHANFDKNLSSIKKHLFERKFIAVGEIGIDLYWDKTFINEQKEAFGIQIEWQKNSKFRLLFMQGIRFKEIYEVLDAT